VQWLTVPSSGGLANRLHPVSGTEHEEGKFTWQPQPHSCLQRIARGNPPS